MGPAIKTPARSAFHLALRAGAKGALSHPPQVLEFVAIAVMHYLCMGSSQ